MNWLYGIFMLAVVGMVCVFGFRMMRATKDKVDRGDAKWTDDWDPFT
jgi:hypothetical protein